MEIETISEERAAPIVRAFSLADCALVTIWLLVMLLVFRASSAVTRPFLNTAVFSSAVLCIGIERSRAAVLACIAVPFLGLALWFKIPPISAVLLAAGCGGVLVMTYHAFLGSQEDQQGLRIGAGLPLFILLAASVNGLIVALTPRVYDALLLKWDFGICAALWHWTFGGQWRLTVVEGIYESLPLAAAIVIAGSSGLARKHLLRAVCLAPVLAIPCYLIFPAVGLSHLGQLNAARNCMPSLHLAWAALLWLNARQGWLRRFALGFVFATAFATLATGEHYVLDLVAAIPFVLAVQLLSEPQPNQG
jgi:hypothetical protein